MPRTAVLICTAADKPAAMADSALAGTSAGFNVELNATGLPADPVTHYGANAAGIEDAAYEALALYFGVGNPYGRVMRDGDVDNFWSTIESLGLKRVVRGF